MKALGKTTVPFLILVAVSGGVSAADLSFDLGFASAYVWRGFSVTDGPVFQPAITGSHESGWSVNVWGNLDLDDANDLSGDFNEIDLTVGYGWGDHVSYELGLIEYLFPNGFGDGTREVYFTLGFGGALSPSVSLYYDFDEVEDYYGTFSLEYGNALSGNWSYTLGIIVGFAGEDFAEFYSGFGPGLASSGLHEGNASLSLDYEKGALGFSIFAAYTDNLDDDVMVEQAVDFYGGVAVSLSF